MQYSESQQLYTNNDHQGKYEFENGLIIKEPLLALESNRGKNQKMLSTFGNNFFLKIKKNSQKNDKAARFTMNYKHLKLYLPLTPNYKPTRRNHTN